MNLLELNSFEIKDKKILIDGVEVKGIKTINIHKAADETGEITIKFLANIIGLDND